MTHLPAGNPNGTHASVPTVSLLLPGIIDGRRTIWSAAQ
jgi:hypothetical protein